MSRGILSEPSAAEEIPSGDGSSTQQVSGPSSSPASYPIHGTFLIATAAPIPTAPPAGSASFEVPASEDSPPDLAALGLQDLDVSGMGGDLAALMREDALARQQMFGGGGGGDQPPPDPDPAPAEPAAAPDAEEEPPAQFVVRVRFHDVMTGKLAHHVNLCLPPSTTPIFIPQDQAQAQTPSPAPEDAVSPDGDGDGGVVGMQQLQVIQVVEKPFIADVSTVPRRGVIVVSAYDAAVKSIRPFSSAFTNEPRRRIYVFSKSLKVEEEDADELGRYADRPLPQTKKLNPKIEGACAALFGVILAGPAIERLWGFAGNIIWSEGKTLFFVPFDAFWNDAFQKKRDARMRALLAEDPDSDGPPTPDADLLGMVGAGVARAAARGAGRTARRGSARPQPLYTSGGMSRSSRAGMRRGKAFASRLVGSGSPSPIEKIDLKPPFERFADGRHFATVTEGREICLFDMENGVCRNVISRGHRNSKAVSQAIVDIIPTASDKRDKKDRPRTKTKTKKSCWRKKTLAFVSVGSERSTIRVWGQDPKKKRMWRRWRKLAIPPIQEADVTRLPSRGAVWLGDGRVGIVEVVSRRIGESERVESRMQIWELDAGVCVRTFPLGLRGIPDDVFALKSSFIGVRWGREVKIFSKRGDCLHSYSIYRSPRSKSKAIVRFCAEETLNDVPTLDAFVFEEQGVLATSMQVSSEEDRASFVDEILQEEEQDEPEEEGEDSADRRLNIAVELSFGNADVLVPKSLLTLSAHPDADLLIDENLIHKDLNVDPESLLQLLWGKEPANGLLPRALDLYLLFKRLKMLSHALVVCCYPFLLTMNQPDELELTSLATDTLRRLGEKPPKASCAFSEAVIHAAKSKIKDVATRKALLLDEYVLQSCRIGELPEFADLKIPMGETFQELFRSTISVALETKRFVNVSLETEDTCSIPAHRELLIRQNEWFYRIFRFPGVESRGPSVLIEGLSGEALEVFVHYVYYGSFPSLRPDRTTNLYSLLLLGFLCEKYCDDVIRRDVLDHIRVVTEQLCSREGFFEVELFRCGFLFLNCPEGLFKDILEIWLEMWGRVLKDDSSVITRARLDAIVRNSPQEQEVETEGETGLHQDAVFVERKRLLLLSDRSAKHAAERIRIREDGGEGSSLEALRRERRAKIEGGLLKKLFGDAPQRRPQGRGDGGGGGASGGERCSVM